MFLGLPVGATVYFAQPDALKVGKCRHNICELSIVYIYLGNSGFNLKRS